ncbi:MAG: bifunctional 2-polyprenyl-6-hydroxyphenol methylase/3-demethylubiquinol 3-O-methyltransferase UbiG [Pseudomonadota bacterium]
MSTSPMTNLDQREVERFGAVAQQWWDPTGEFRPLHLIGPARISFIRQTLERALPHVQDHGGAANTGRLPLGGVRLLDVGCGGGLTAEPLAKLGAEVTAIDPAEQSIGVARHHAGGRGIEVDYRVATIEEIRAEQASGTCAMFDAVVCLEVVEHVPDVPAFVAACVGACRPGGTVVFSTINRTRKAYALAIVGAEYVLRWLPRGTHRWDRFVTPEELEDALEAGGARVIDERGLAYDLLTDVWRLSDDLDVNYMLAAQVRGARGETGSTGPTDPSQ